MSDGDPSIDGLNEPPSDDALARETESFVVVTDNVRIAVVGVEQTTLTARRAERREAEEPAAGNARWYGAEEERQAGRQAQYVIVIVIVIVVVAASVVAASVVVAVVVPSPAPCPLYPRNRPP